MGKRCSGGAVVFGCVMLMFAAQVTPAWSAASEQELSQAIGGVNYPNAKCSISVVTCPARCDGVISKRCLYSSGDNCEGSGGCSGGGPCGTNPTTGMPCAGDCDY